LNHDREIRLLTEIVAMEKQEQSSIFGESLPSGLVLGDSAKLKT
jgi:hypothetical protein